MPAAQLAAPILLPCAIGTQSPLFIGMAPPAAVPPSIAVVPPPEPVTDVPLPRLSCFGRWLQRLSRQDCQRQLKAVTEQRLLAERLAQDGDCDTAASAYIQFGRMLWYAGQSWGDGRWFEAEEAWVRGALLALHFTPALPVTDEALWRQVIATLTERRVIQQNPRKGIIPGDDHLAGIELGLGGLAHVWKIFGLGAAVKVYDGGMRKYRSAEFQREISDAERRTWLGWDVAGLKQAANLGLGAAMVYYADDYFIVRQVWEGVTHNHITDAMDEGDIPRILASYELFRKKLREAGLDTQDLGGNAAWNRQTRQWVLFDS